MKQLPDRPDLDHLRKQAKSLLALYRARDPAAIERFHSTLPAAIAAGGNPGLRLHDAQSCVAREYGFTSWADLKSYVEARSAPNQASGEFHRNWLQWVYAGDVVGNMNRARPSVAARILAENPTLTDGHPYLACAIGDVARLRLAAKDDPGWIHRPGGPLNLPPLVAVTHSSLIRLAAFREGLLASARLLLALGADPNQAIGSRWPPSSLIAPSDDHRLSALYGAAGQNHDAELTQLLLDAGADPNDGESLYHALEHLDCTRRLLAAGARITGSNALYRVLDFDLIEALRLLLSHGADANEPDTSDWRSPLLWAIRRRRSPAHVAALLDAGAVPSVCTPDGTSAYTWAQRFGLPAVATLLRAADGVAHDTDEELFIAACARSDEAGARRIQAARPDLPATLSAAQLRLLPELAAQGCREAVQLMVTLGWPIATPGGDWQASALNHAVFRGDAALTRFLLEHGASWQETHGYDDNARGTLSWASINEPVDGGDWLGCAQALVAHGMPAKASVIGTGQRSPFSDEVRDFLLGEDA